MNRDVLYIVLWILLTAGIAIGSSLVKLYFF